MQSMPAQSLKPPMHVSSLNPYGCPCLLLQDFIGSTIVAYLDGCGVKVSGYRRLNSLASPMLISEQATLRRIRDLPPTDDGLPPDPPFRLELCPDGQEIGCY